MVTLGIIGVVSAMTVPSLMQNYQRQSYVTQLHKFYNELSQAIVQYVTEQNAINIKEAGLTTAVDTAEDFIKKHFKVVTSCGNNFSPCMLESYKKLSGQSISLKIVGGNEQKCFTLASGAGLCTFKGNGNVLSQIAVDINGQKGPNIVGRDLFLLYIYSNGMVDDLKTGCKDENDKNCVSWNGNNTTLTKDEREDMFNKACNSSAKGFHGCFGKILNDNWQMTY